MKKRITLTNNSYFLYFASKRANAKTILIIPNTAGYFAKSIRYDEAGPRIDKFCEDLSEFYEVYYLVLPGQDPSIPGKYSYTGSISVVLSAIHSLLREKKCTFAGFIGLCTGGVILTEALDQITLNDAPVIIYNTAHKVGWNKVEGQMVFLEKYGATKYGGESGNGPVTLDLEELTKNAPRTLTPLIAKHRGRMLQLISGNSDYKIELQNALKVPGMESKTFMTMSDAPIAESKEYPQVVDMITKFFG